MDGIETSSEGRQTTDHGKRIRRQWTAAVKRRIVREAEKPGAVRLEVTQRHGVHVSVLNRRRTELQKVKGGDGSIATRVRSRTLSSSLNLLEASWYSVFVADHGSRE